VTLAKLDREARRARLETALKRHPEAARLVADWLSAPRDADELASLQGIRTALWRSPKLHKQLVVALGGPVRLDALASRADAPPAVALAGSPGSSPSCGDPFLRVRIAQLHVYEEDDDFYNDEIYCLVHSESNAGDEVRLTVPTSPLDEGDSKIYTLEDGVVWGIDAPKNPEGPLLLTYECFELDGPNDWSYLLESLKQGLDELAGMYAWAALAGAAVSIINQAIALDADDHLFSAQQSLPAEEFLDATHGVAWSVRKSGTNLNSLWDWELQMQAWGCAQLGQ
jgi:hypothetical protein